MRAERLAAMPQLAVGFDLETDLIQPGLSTPPIACGSLAEYTPNGIRGALLTIEQARGAFEAMLLDPNTIIVGANIAGFDIPVLAVDAAARGKDLMPLIFEAFDPTGEMIRGRCDGRVFDIQRAEELHAIAQGNLGKDPWTGRDTEGLYSLNGVTRQVTGRVDAKANDRFRLRYYELRNVPMHLWPHEARQYPIDDACNTLEDGLGQAGHMPSCWVHDWRDDGRETRCQKCGAVLTLSGPPQECHRLQPRRNLHDVARQTYFSFAASLGQMWGFKVDQAAVDKLEAQFGPEYEAAGAPFREAGIIRPNGAENQNVLKKLIATAYGATRQCKTCSGTGKVPSPATAGKTKINCATCDGTGLELTPQVPRTDKDHIRGDRDSLQESGDELLIAYEDYGAKEKHKTTYIPLLRDARVCIECGMTGYTRKRSRDKIDPPHRDGCSKPGWREVALQPRTRPLVETGRCAVGGGLHGLPRKGGIRECIVARDGYVLSSEDFTAGELVTLSEVCHVLVGFSKLGEALNAELDAHLALAGTMTGRDYDTMKALKKAGDKRAADDRQAAKAANFGFPGGMAELTFTLRKRSEPDLFTPCEGGPDERDGVVGFKGLRTCVMMDGAKYCGFKDGRNIKVMTYNDSPCSPVCSACLEAARRLREFWHKQWPEMKQFFAIVKKLIATPGPSGTAEIVHLMSDRIRGGVGFCDGANGLFQGLLADAAKNAYCQVARECFDRTWVVRDSEMMTSKYAGGQSPLWMSRPLVLFHDECLVEHPESVAHDAASRVSEIMVEALRFACPHHTRACKAEPTLMRKMYKGAEPVRDANGRLIPWEPKKKAA